jgi:hypothetical protein
LLNAIIGTYDVPRLDDYAKMQAHP